MSFSFQITAPSKQDATDQTFTELVKVASQQSIHAKDSEQCFAAASAFIALLSDPSDAQEVRVMVNGSLSWTGNLDAITSITAANISVSAYLVDKGQATQQ
jgi:hypothetical protein